MKLIQHLERKLSWRRKQPGVQNANGKSEAKSRKTAKKFASAAIKVSDSEFSQYIRFASPLKTVPTSSVPSYEIVNIRTKSPFQSANVSAAQPVCQYRSPSPRREDAFDMHIYDKINCRTRLSPQPRQSPVSPVSPVSRSGKSLGPITVTSTYRRNRIKTNPWFNSPWAGKKTFPSCTTNSNSENVYESIDNLNWKEKSKENLSPARLQLSGAPQSNHLVDWNYNPLVEQLQSTPISRRVGTYLKGRLPHHLDPYPQSSIAQLSPSETDPFIGQVPSPEFVNQSHQICNEISSYFETHQSPKMHSRDLPHVQVATCRPSLVGENLFSKFDSMETIDLTPNLNEYGRALSEWSLQEDSIQQPQPEHLQANSTFSSAGTSSAEQSPNSGKSRKSFDEKYMKPSKRKRPESIYSTRQSKKVDKLKCQLKEVVHAAILEAKKEDTKKA